MFLACGHNGQRVVSDDGLHWKNQVFGKDGELYNNAAIGNGRIVCVGRYGGQNIMASSADGVNWKTSNYDAKYKSYMQGLAFGNGGFLALGGEPVTVGAGDEFIMTSADGEQWSPMIKTSSKFLVLRLAWGVGRWVGVGNRGRRATSPDGKVWEDMAKTKAVDTLVDVAFGNGVFVGVGLHGLRMSSKDGLNWENRQTGIEGEHLNSIVWAENRFVAIGLGGTWTSADGAVWDRKDNKDAPLAATYAKGAYVGVHWKGRILHSVDALSWEQVYKSDEHLEAVASGF